MEETIGKEIVRLLREISEVEQELKETEQKAEAASREEYAKNGYATKIRICKESLDRKMQLLGKLRK